MKPVKRTDFQYTLPTHQIAAFPLPQRSASRLLYLNRATGDVSHYQFDQLPGLLQPGDLLIFNDTKVIPARLYGYKETGGRVELLIERCLNETKALAHIQASRPPQVNSHIYVEGHKTFRVTDRHEALFEIQSLAGNIRQVLDQWGHMPLPPYIKRSDEPIDQDRYQTCYARREGAVAAPTAGLHFDPPLFQALKNQRIKTGYLTLHVGAGTFQPVRVQCVAQHQMHTEFMELPRELCETINRTKREGGRVIAVGTTSVRALETAAQSQTLQPYQGETDIFIYPGYQFQLIDGMITNFHLPESTLLMLVCAFGGYHEVFHAYYQAIAKQYRFYSYGDAMLIL